MKKRLLVTGISGFLGAHFLRQPPEDYQVIGQYHRFCPEGYSNLLSCDLSRYTDLKALLATVKPDAVIHLAAISDAGVCANYPRESSALNVTATANLAGLCADRKIPLAIASTDLVFDGTKAPYREEDSPTPVNRYGEQKALAEMEALIRYEKAVVCRLPLMYGRPGFGKNSGFFHPLLQQLKAAVPVTLFTDEHRTPLAGDLAKNGLLLALQKANGILHLGGDKRISRFDLAQLIVELFRIRKAVLVPRLQSEVQLAAARPPDVSLNSNKALGLGFFQGSLETELENLARQDYDTGGNST